MLRPILLLAAVAALAGCDSTDPLAPIPCDDAPLVVENVGPTGGQAVNQGSFVTVAYVGRLASGAVFDSTRTGQPARFALGQTVAGFRLGIGGTAAFPAAQVPEIQPMTLGSRRRITIPPNLGYGGSPARNPQTGDPLLNADGSERIPACSTLIFDVTLLDAQ